VPVFHLTTPEAWAHAQASGQVAPPSLADEGFIHCSTDEQLAGTIERHFAGVDELRLLELDPALEDDLRWEESRPGEVYPHLYRPLAVGEVARVVDWRRGDPLS
jgi:uncharacterized protein (DUF952 family)